MVFFLRQAGREGVVEGAVAKFPIDNDAVQYFVPGDLLLRDLYDVTMF